MTPAESGAANVPAVVRASGAAAEAAYADYFAARLTNASTRTLYAGYARRFFAWLGDRAADLSGVTHDHVAAFLAELSRTAPSSATVARAALRGLFAFLRLRGVIAAGPAAGARAGRRALNELRAAVRELAAGPEDGERFRAAMVVLYPVAVGGMDPEVIAAATGIPADEVRRYVGRLRENGVWRDDGHVSVTADDMAGPEGIVELCFQVGCATGVFCRVPADGPPAGPGNE